MLVTLRGVGHAFSDQQELFTDVSHEFRRGSTCALVGPSGSGKSTLLAVIAGMLRPTHGEVLREPSLRTLWVFQNPHGVAGRTALDHVALPVVARGASRREAVRRADALLDEFGLRHRRHAAFAELSGGEAQRVMLARAVAAEPDLLLVDEPTAQLDRVAAIAVNTSIGALAGRGMGIVVATHDPITREACRETLDLGEA